ncbi:MAG: serine hydrolase domain-containing protein [Bacteroidota bacterium]
MWYKYHCLWISALLLLGINVLPACQFPQSEARFAERLQGTMDSLRKVTDIAGIGVALINAEGKLSEYFAGYADREKKQAFQSGDRFLMGSVGKTYVSALILQEVEAAKLSLDDRVSQWFGGQVWYDSLANSNEITVRMLLNHTSGLPRWVFKPAVWQAMQANPDKVWTQAERFAGIASDPALHPPGKGWAYSDTNYLLLGMILEQLNGQSFYGLLAERIFKVHGLEDTAPSDKRDLDRLVAGYTGAKSPFMVPPKVSEDSYYAINPQFEWTGGGLVCTPADLARWARILYSGQALREAQMQALLQTAPYPTRLPGDARYGLGVMVRTDSLGLNYGHEGFMPGFQTVVIHYPEQEFTIALMVNEDQMSGKHDNPLYEWAGLLASLVD